MARVPIIAMTASATAEERDRCRDAGMDDFVSKPVVPAVLERTLARWVPTAADQAVAASAAEARLRELVADGFDTALVRKIIGRFAEGAQQILTDLRAAVAAGDPTATAERAHRLRGSALNLGLLDLAACCADIEERARAGGLPDGDTVDQLGVAVTAAGAELDQASGWLR